MSFLTARIVQLTTISEFDGRGSKISTWKKGTIKVD